MSKSFTLNGNSRERNYVSRLKKAIHAYDAAYGSGRDDDPDTDDPNDNGEQAIADFLKARLEPDDYQRVMQALALGGGNRDRVMELLSEGGSDDEPDREREDRLDHIPLDRARDGRSGLTPSARTAQDALPSRSAEAGFRSRFPSAVRPGQLPPIS